MTTPDPSHLLATLTNMSPAPRDQLVRMLGRLMKDENAKAVGIAPVWHALAALAAEISANERQVLDALEVDAEDGIGGIVGDTPDDAPLDGLDPL